MKKIRTQDSEDECPVCGGIIWKGVKVLIEGAKITVCQSCAQYGKRIIEEKKIRSPPTRKSIKIQSKKSQITSNSEDNFGPSIEIVPDYAQRIRDLRMKLNLNQEKFAKKLNEKPSLLKRIETGKLVPSLQLAKKFEELYNIKLITEAENFEVNIQKYLKKPSSRSSLGDIAFIKKKKEE